MSARDDTPRRPRRVNAAGDAGGGTSGAGTKPRKVWRGATGKAASNQGSREVIVRVTGRTKSVRTLGAQLVYNARGGSLDAEHSSGRVLYGKEDLHVLRDRWAEENSVLARHPSCPTQSLGVVLSMPAGTDAAAVRAAAVAWARRHLTPRTEWLATVHHDRAHPHAHVAIRAVQDDGRRIAASPAEIQQWRESFARGLQSLGIEAHATPRREKMERLLSRGDDRHERSQAQPQHHERAAPPPELPGFGL